MSVYISIVVRRACLQTIRRSGWQRSVYLTGPDLWLANRRSNTMRPVRRIREIS
ncbi:hypothetical protein [Sideroxydans sp. CL21]|nr:hypothetical protein [Sideroxydans sp. CL21]